MTGRPPDHVVTIHGVSMTLPQASKLTCIALCSLWREALNNSDLTAYVEKRRAPPKQRVRKSQQPNYGLRAKARELAAHPDAAVSADTIRSRLKRGWDEQTAMLCAKGAW